MLKLRGNIWQWSDTIDGKRHRLSTGESTREKAVLKVKDYLKALKLGEAVPSVGMIKPDAGMGLTLKLAFDRALRQDWKGNPSWQTYDINSRHAMRILGDDLLLEDLNQKHLNALKAELYDEEYATGTVNRILTTLSSVMTLACVVWEEIERRPYFKFDPEDNRRMRLVSQAEEIALLQAAPHQEIADLLLHLADTGCRLGEALRVSAIDLDLEIGIVKLWKTKNKNPRAVPLTERLIKLWDRRNKQPFALTKDAAEYWFKQTKKFAEIDDDELVMHSFRHTCATQLLEAGVPIDKAQHWLGHKSIATTQRYAKMTRGQLDAAVKLFDKSKSIKVRDLKVV